MSGNLYVVPKELLQGLKGEKGLKGLKGEKWFPQGEKGLKGELQSFEKGFY